MIKCRQFSKCWPNLNFFLGVVFPYCNILLGGVHYSFFLFANSQPTHLFCRVVFPGDITLFPIFTWSRVCLSVTYISSWCCVLMKLLQRHGFAKMKWKRSHRMYMTVKSRVNFSECSCQHRRILCHFIKLKDFFTIFMLNKRLFLSHICTRE